jgi:HemY protein
MIRVVIYFIVVGALAFAAVWLADRPGDVLITWQNRRIETSVMMLVVAFASVAVLTTVSWIVLRALVRSPGVLRRHARTRRGARGFAAVSQGLIAVGSGDVRAARKYADEAIRYAPNEPLTLLLSAQASQLAGDRDTATGTFHVMAGREDTRLLGLHGLYVEAQRRDDVAAARRYAEEAAKSVHAPAWAGLAVFHARCVAGDWIGALDRLDHNMKAGLVDRETHRRHRAVLLTARALAAEENDPASARTLALEAVKLAPTLVPAAALAGSLLGAARDLRRAARIVEAAWIANPHPDLAETYAHLRPGDSARDRLTRVQTLAEKTPSHVEGALAVARAALDAQEFAIARTALAPLLVSPTQRVAMLMSKLEESEHGDEGRAREWMTRAVHARRDPAWTADGVISDRWMPASPVTGRLDAFQWKEPLAELGTVDESRKRRLLEGPSVPHPEQPSATEEKSDTLDPPPSTLPPRVGRGRSSASVTPAVIPMVHVPDDPGPEPEERSEPETEPSAATGTEGWNKLRGLFR